MAANYQGLTVLMALMGRLRQNSLKPVLPVGPGQLGHGIGIPTYLNAKQLQPKAPPGPQLATAVSQARFNQAMLNKFRGGKPGNLDVARMMFGKLPLGGKI